jgi:hypothetical protein
LIALDASLIEARAAQDATVALLRCRGLAPGNLDVWSTLDRAYMDDDALVLALAAFRHAQRLAPRSIAIVHCLLAAALAVRQGAAEAARLAATSERDPLDPILRKARGLDLDALVLLDQAVDALDAALALTPEEREPIRSLAGVLTRTARSRDAEVALRQALNFQDHLAGHRHVVRDFAGAARIAIGYAHTSTGDAPTATRFRESFRAFGIDLQRVTTRGSSPHRTFLANYNDIDLVLDPFPYCGGLTTCAALWMGVPTVTLPGKIFASRHSASHLEQGRLCRMGGARSDRLPEHSLVLGMRPDRSYRVTGHDAGPGEGEPAMGCAAVWARTGVCVTAHVARIISGSAFNNQAGGARPS